MGLKIKLHRDNPVATVVISDRRLWLTADRSEVVEEGDPKAAHLFCAGPGRRIPIADAERYGLVAADGKASSNNEDEKTTKKAKSKPGDKSRKKKTPNKSRR